MTPLEEWMHVLNRPLRTDILASARNPTVRTDYSSLHPLDAYPLLYHLCYERYGSIDALNFSVNSHHRPQGTSTGLMRPDGSKSEFITNRTYAHPRQAMLETALLAVQQGAIQFILGGPSILPSKGSSVLPSASIPPRQVNANSIGQASHIPKELLGPALQQTKATNAEIVFNTLFKRVNQAAQHAYVGFGILLPREALEWKVVPIGANKFVAQFTVRLPCGSEQCYGAIHPPCRTYVSAKDARLAVLNLALEAGVLNFISSPCRRDVPVRSPAAPLGALPHSGQAAPSSSTVAPPSTSASSAGHIPPRRALRSPPLYMPDFFITKRGALPLGEESPLPAPTLIPNRVPPSRGTGTKRACSEDHTSSSAGQSQVLESPLPALMGTPAPQSQPATGSAQVPPAKKQKPTPEVAPTAASHAEEREPKGKSGKSHRRMLREFCSRTDRPLPSLALRGSPPDTGSVDSDKYEIYVTFDGVEYQLEDHHPTLRAAEELLSECILTLVGNTPTDK